MDEIQSAKYLINEETNLNWAVHLFLSGDKQMTVPIDPSRDSYNEIMDMVEAGDLTIADAD